MQKVKIGSAEIYMAFAVLSEDLENINSRRTLLLWIYLTEASRY